MKLSVTTLGWPGSPLDTILGDIKAAGGFAGIDFRGLGDELNITRLPAFNENLAQTLAVIKSAGLVISGLATSIKLVADAKGNRFEEEAEPYCRLADKLGVQPIRVFGGARRKDRSRQQWMDEAVQTLTRILYQTAGRKAWILVETHDDWCRSADVAELLDKVADPRAGALWDVLITGLMGQETPAQSVANLGKHIRYTHVKDGHRAGDKFAIDLPGDGKVDIAGAVRALKSIGYDGWLTFEWEKRWHPDIPDASVALPAYRKAVEAAM